MKRRIVLVLVQGSCCPVLSPPACVAVRLSICPHRNMDIKLYTFGHFDNFCRFSVNIAVASWSLLECSLEGWVSSLCPDHTVTKTSFREHYGTLLQSLCSRPKLHLGIQAYFKGTFKKILAHLEATRARHLTQKYSLKPEHPPFLSILIQLLRSQ